MSPQLVVMTSEKVDGKFKIYRKALDDLDDIPRTGVLFIAISCEDSVKPRLNGRRRLCQSSGRDWYTLIVRKNNAMLAAWDDGDFEWKRLTDPWDESATTKPDHLPMSGSPITFRGVWIDTEEWHKALEQCNNELH